MKTTHSTRPVTNRGQGSNRDSRSAPTATRRPPDLRDTPVIAVMGRPPVAIEMSQGLDVALGTLAAHGLRHLVVVNAGSCTGLLSDRVVTSMWAGEPTRFEAMPVGDLCGGLRPFVSADASLADAARMMRRCGTDAVVVIDGDGRPLGVVTTTDIVALMAKPRLP